jgi:hypothetical protein
MLKELHTIQRIRTTENEASIVTLQKCATQLCVEVKHGLGFRSTKSSTFMVIIWLLPQTLVHYPNNTLWTTPTPTSRSVYWSSILKVKHHLHSNVTLQIHDGSSSIWSSPQTHIWANIHDHLLLPITNNPLPNNVSDLWIQGTTQWDHHLLSTTFSAYAVQEIEATPVVPSDQHGILRWTPSIKGQCTTKAAYNHLVSSSHHYLPSQGSRSITPEANSILQKVWKGKSIPPFLKTFAWRLIRRAVPTAERAGRYSSHIDKHCTYCGNIENDVHLFFLCDLSRQVRATYNPPLHTHNLNSDEDGIQLSLPALITSTPTEQILCQTLFLMWYIWKARNDNRFQRRTWTPFQVHKATAAHMQTHLSAWEEHHKCPAAHHHNYSSFAHQPPTFNSTIPDHDNINHPFYQMHCPSSGVICYTDASISPDVYSPRLRQVGTGIKFVNMQVQPHNIICITTLVKDVSSVVMVEAAALAMAASIALKFGFMQVSFLTDSSQLQQFLSAPDLNNPPDWRMSTYTQQYLSSTA